MRPRHTIEREIYQAREDLEARLAELRRVVRDKVNIKARAQAALAQKKQQAKMLALRGAAGIKYGVIRTKDGAVFVYRRAVDVTRERPILVGSIAAVLVASVVTLLLVRRARRPWWQKL
jgi:hypothetical protein